MCGVVRVNYSNDENGGLRCVVWSGLTSNDENGGLRCVV